MVTTPELAPGFRLAGAAVDVARSAEEAARAVAGHVAAPEGGIVAVHEPYLEAFDPALRRRLEALVNPVVVGLPAGDLAADAGGRRLRLAEMLRRAVGYRITLAGDEG